MTHSNNRNGTKFKSIVIGKKSIGAVMVFAVVTAVCILFQVSIKYMNNAVTEIFYKNCIKMTIPYISASDLNKGIYNFKLKDISDKFYIGLIKQIPYFYELDSNLSESEQVFNYENEDSQSITKPTNDIVINTGNIIEHTNSSVDLDIKNETGYELDKEELAEKYGIININTDKKPQILIVHTHGSESYTQSEKYHYSQSDYARCQDTRYNVVRVGEELYKELTKRGFNVIHDRTINDYPSYNNSYNKTLARIEKHLKENPTIKCVFDVHRDAIMYDDEVKLKLTKTVNGEKAAQVMIVCGSDASGLENPNWRENLGFALKIQREMEHIAPGLMRPLNLRKERFNMHKTTGSLLFEFGTHGNTLDEALASVKYIAEGISKVLK